MGDRIYGDTLSSGEANDGAPGDLFSAYVAFFLDDRDDDDENDAKK